MWTTYVFVSDICMHSLCIGLDSSSDMGQLVRLPATIDLLMDYYVAEVSPGEVIIL